MNKQTTEMNKQNQIEINTSKKKNIFNTPQISLGKILF